MRVILIGPVSVERVAQIAAVDARLQVEQAWDRFAPELVAEWPAQTVEWYLPPRFRNVTDSADQRASRDALLSGADVIALTFPYPIRVRARAPRLRFVHQFPAGISNLTRSDLWQGEVPVTSGRGAGNTLPIAEWAIAAALAFSKEFPRAAAQRSTGRLNRGTFHGRQVAGKTMGIVGVGGIGREVARLARALGMRVVGVRRSAEPVEHVEQIYPPAELHAMLAQSDVVVMATQLTAETDRLLDAASVAAMKPGAVLINVARGELIDEDALIQALRSGHLGGFAGDVYEGEFERQPRAELLELENVILTPHTSSQTEHPSRASLEIFCENLKRCLAGQPLLQQVDWERGY